MRIMENTESKSIAPKRAATAIDDERKSPQYSHGFHDGFWKGQEQGLEMATKALALSTRPMSIVVPEGSVMPPTLSTATNRQLVDELCKRAPHLHINVEMNGNNCGDDYLQHIDNEEGYIGEVSLGHLFLDGPWQYSIIGPEGEV
jgi:hypothetical protein